MFWVLGIAGVNPLIRSPSPEDTLINNTFASVIHDMLYIYIVHCTCMYTCMLYMYLYVYMHVVCTFVCEPCMGNQSGHFTYRGILIIRTPQ